MEKELRLYEEKVTIVSDGADVKTFLIYLYGIRRYYHINVNEVISNWVKGGTNPDAFNPRSLSRYIRKNYPKASVMTETDLKNYRAFKKFMKVRK